MQRLAERPAGSRVASGDERSERALDAAGRPRHLHRASRLDRVRGTPLRSLTAPHASAGRPDRCAARPLQPIAERRISRAPTIASAGSPAEAQPLARSQSPARAFRSESRELSQRLWPTFILRHEFPHPTRDPVRSFRRPQRTPKVASGTDCSRNVATVTPWTVGDCRARREACRRRRCRRQCSRASLESVHDSQLEAPALMRLQD
jgi:hypothetical protein